MIRLRLNKEKDKDLCKLYYSMGAQSFSKFVKECLYASLYGKVGRINIPPITDREIESVSVRLSFNGKWEAINGLFVGLSDREVCGYVLSVVRLNLGLSFVRANFIDEYKAGEYIETHSLIKDNAVIAIPKRTRVQSPKPVTPPASTAQPVREPVITPAPFITESFYEEPVPPQASNEDKRNTVFSMLQNLIDD